MGYLQNVGSNHLCELRSEHLVGRSARCDLRLRQPTPSVVAMLRWHEGWQLLALRTSGVLVDAQPLPAETWVDLTVGMTLDFGEASQWRFVDDTPPRCFGYTVDFEGPDLTVYGQRESLALPDPEDAEELEVQVIQVSRQWYLEQESGRRSVLDQEVVAAGGRMWRLCLPTVVESTERAQDEGVLLLDDVEVHLLHHDDKRFVGLEVRWPDGAQLFGERQRYRLLLELAEARLEGEAWLYDDWLFERLGINSNQMNRWTHDLRSDFRSIGVQDAHAIVERRGVYRRKDDSRQRSTGAHRLRVAMGFQN